VPVKKSGGKGIKGNSGNVSVKDGGQGGRRLLSKLGSETERNFRSGGVGKRKGG